MKACGAAGQAIMDATDVPRSHAAPGLAVFPMLMDFQKQGLKNSGTDFPLGRLFICE